MRKKIKIPGDVPAGFAALKPYTLNDDSWSPADALEALMESPAVRKRVGEIIARAKADEF